MQEFHLKVLCVGGRVLHGRQHVFSPACTTRTNHTTSLLQYGCLFLHLDFSLVLELDVRLVWPLRAASTVALGLEVTQHEGAATKSREYGASQGADCNSGMRGSENRDPNRDPSS